MPFQRRGMPTWSLQSTQGYDDEVEKLGRDRDPSCHIAIFSPELFLNRVVSLATRHSNCECQSKEVDNQDRVLDLVGRIIDALTLGSCELPRLHSGGCAAFVADDITKILPGCARMEKARPRVAEVDLKF